MAFLSPPLVGAALSVELTQEKTRSIAACSEVTGQLVDFPRQGPGLRSWSSL